MSARGPALVTAVLVGLLLVSGCLPPADPSAFATTVPAAPVAAPRPAPVGHRAPIADEGRLRRAARRMTVRIRVSGCGRFGTGSGLVVDERLVVTNRHVVANATSVSVSTWDGQSIEAEVEGVDTTDDLAVIHVDRDLPGSADLASADADVGSPVTAVGFPLGGRQELSVGDVVDYARLDDHDGPRVMRISSEVWPGSSGGPVLDADGRVVGVVFAVERATDHGLAVPVSELRHLLDGGVRSAAAGCTPDASGV